MFLARQFTGEKANISMLDMTPQGTETIQPIVKINELSFQIYAAGVGMFNTQQKQSALTEPQPAPALLTLPYNLH
jgi:hypothetical protein